MNFLTGCGPRSKETPTFQKTNLGNSTSAAWDKAERVSMGSYSMAPGFSARK